MEHVPKGKNGGPLENTALKTLQQIQVTPALGESSYDAISRRLKSVSTLSDAFSCVSDMCNRYGFSHFLIAHPPDVGCSMVAEDILLTNLSLYLGDDLISLGMFDDWSVLTHLNTTSTPFIWSKRNGIVGGEDDGDGNGGGGGDEGARLTGADALIASEIDTQFAHCNQTYPEKSDHPPGTVAGW